MEKKGFNKLIGFNVFTITLVLIVFLGGVGLTYAYYAFSYEEESVIVGNVVNVDIDLEVELVVGTNEEMVPLNNAALSNALNAVGSTNGACVDQYNNLSCQVYKITVINKGSRVKHLNGTIELYAKEGTGNVYNNLKWREITNPTTVKNDAVVNGMEESTLVSDLTMESKTERSWYIAVWISETDSDQIETDKGLFGGTVTFIAGSGSGGTGNKITNVFAERIMKPIAKSDASIDFSQTSKESNTNGVYLRSGTENAKNPIYYYRGNVNNNLIFANTCWKVVRTTETGGLKLIYNGVPTNGQCNNTGTATTVGFLEFNDANNSSLAQVGYMYRTRNNSMQFDFSDNPLYIYGNDVTWISGIYTLVDTISGQWSDVYENGLMNYHYTCFGGTTCSRVSYINFTTDRYAYYIELSGGNKIEDEIKRMLGSDDTLELQYQSSTLKGSDIMPQTIDNWYYTNIEQKGYKDYLEDTVWCNDRSIYSLGGFNPNGGPTYGNELYFSTWFSVFERFMLGTSSPSLSCNRNIDKFTVDDKNGNGFLDYPIGLLTGDEVVLAGANSLKTANNTYYLYNGYTYWTITPIVFTAGFPMQIVVKEDGSLNLEITAYEGYIRPSISLKPGFILTGNGDGSVTNPYVVG